MSFGKVFVRLSIICFWILLIFIALYFPSWKIFPIEEKNLNVFAWGDILDPKVLADFERDTGIKINLSYYASNEELQVKMKATRGQGYDLILPSDYTVALLIKEELLQPLDHKKLHFYSDLYPALLNHEFDPQNRYSIPFEWEIYGFGIDRRFFDTHPFVPSWRAIFDPDVVDYKIVLKNDPIESVLFAAFYLFGQTDSLTPTQFDQVRQLLLMQRDWVEAYTDFRADYFIASGSCPLALSSTAYIKRIHNFFPQIEFIIPEEGSFVTIENFCITKASTKQDYAYKLLNYIYTKESLISHYKNYWYFPAILSPKDELGLTEDERKLYEYSREEFTKFHFFKNIYPQQQVRDLWVEVKSF
ncbi:MAG: Spermidine/putrescine-binding periplasmic protein [Chlamydiae bacterium]|nr:Spermidine/putrescine-binding periplasmic protein [Chlamydiota bacterium]